MKLSIKFLTLLFIVLINSVTLAFSLETKPLKFGVGLFQPDKEKNDQTYKAFSEYLSKKLNRQVEMRTVDTWEGLAKSLSNGETDIALLGPWGYVLANNESEAQVIATILYDGKPEYHALIVTHPDSKIERPIDLKGKTFAFGDKGSTSGYLIPFYYFQKNFNIKEPEEFFGKVIYTKHQAIETQVTKKELDAGADYNRNRNTMIEQGLIKESESKIIWTSEPLPNDAFAVSQELFKDKKLVKEIQTALLGVEGELKKNPSLFPNHYTGFVVKDNSYYKMIRDAGLSIGKLNPKVKK
jgi:phosphonate transport system substrate-binding protein